MSFSEEWKKIQDQEPMDTMDNMDTIKAEINSVHSVHSVHKSENSKISFPEEVIGEDYYDYHIKLAFDEFNSNGLTLMDFPESTRHRSLILEEKITEAINANDK